jgi:predicted 3-demethylubiquinone-9 3-methyltransferase (glyoxalase superfamily)
MEIKSQKIVPFLWFNKEAEEAMNFYCSVFKDAKRGEVTRMANNGPVLVVTFELSGIKFMALNGGPHYKLNESFSLYVNVDSQKELDELWNKLIADGGEESRCGWLKDKFGLSWQIIPSGLGKWMGDKNPQKSQRVMDALMKMGKLDMQKLQDAFDGK